MHTLSQSLITALESKHGLCGQFEPALVVSQLDNQERRLHALTLGAVLSVFPQPEYWQRIVKLDSWLLDSSQVAYRSSVEMLTTLKQNKLVGPRHQARVWWQICRGIQGRFKGSIRELLRVNQDDALNLLDYFVQSKTTFPVLSGSMVVVRWVDMIHRIGEVSLSRWADLRIPLTDAQQRKALQFNITNNQVHPYVRSALDLWEHACHSYPENRCGLANCPRRNRPAVS